MRKCGMLLVLSLGGGLAGPAQGQATVTTGSGSTFQSISFDANGSVTLFEAPAGIAPLSGSSLEGYAVCSDYTGSQAPHGVTVSGFGVDSGWGPATMSQPGGLNTYPVSFTRDSLDGAVRLTQDYNAVVGYRALNVVLTVKNLTGLPIPNVKISRFFGITIAFPIHWDATDDGMNARTDPSPLSGFQATNNTKQFSLIPSTEIYTSFSAGCVATSALSNPIGPQTGGVGRLDYSVGGLSAGQQKIVRLQYRRY